MDRSSILAAAAAHDLNEELTIIICSVCETLRTLEADHPARPLLLDARRAVQRCAWKSYGLLNYAARAGVPPIRRRMETLL